MILRSAIVRAAELNGCRASPRSVDRTGAASRRRLPAWSLPSRLRYVETGLWGGLPVTLILATYGLVFAFPLGILLALGRRSNLPLIKGLCVGFIELIRGVPLITLLIMASVMLPLFLPAGVDHRQVPARAGRRHRCSPRPIWPRSSAAACRRCPRASTRRPTRWASSYRAEDAADHAAAGAAAS